MSLKVFEYVGHRGEIQRVHIILRQRSEGVYGYACSIAYG